MSHVSVTDKKFMMQALKLASCGLYTSYPNPAVGCVIARDGKISDDEIRDFAFISNKLDEISLAIDSLNLWVDKTAGEQGLNIELFREEKEKQK